MAQRARVVLWRDDDFGLELLTLASQIIRRLGPDATAKDLAGGVDRTPNRDAVDCLQLVSLGNAGVLGRAVRRDHPRGNAPGGVNPRNPVVGKLVDAALLEIQNSEHQQRQTQQRQEDRREPEWKCRPHPDNSHGFERTHNTAKPRSNFASNT